MKTRAKDKVRLSSGETMTLGEALDSGKLRLEECVRYSSKREDSQGRALKITYYIAREPGGNLFWDVGETLYRSRTGGFKAFSNPVDPGPYHVSVLAPKLKLWPRHRDVVVFDEPSQSHALVRVHDLKVDPQIMLVGMKVVLQSEDRQGRWVSLVEYEYEGCRKGWKSTLLK